MTNDQTPETDEQRADREETERDHTSGNHEYCGVTCEAAFPTEMLRNGILAKGYPGTAGMLDELLRRAAASVPVQPPATRAAVRERIAEALMRWADGNNTPRFARRSETVRANAYSRADAVLAVLPEAAALTAAERKFLTFALGQAAEEMSLGDGFTDEDQAALDSLRRMADEEQPGAEAQDAPPREPHPTEADLLHALAVLDRFHGRDTDAPAAEARQDGAQQAEADRG